jgi:hypothetical protein
MSASTGAAYSIYLNDSQGQRLAVVDRWERLEYALVTNDRSSLVLELSPDVTIPSSAVPDGQIEVWRKLPTGREYLDGDKIWYIQTITYRRDGSGRVSITLEAEAPLWLLGEPGRFVDAASGSGEAQKTGSADDICKAIVREQAGSDAAAARQVPGLSVAASVSQGPSMTKAFAWKPVLQTLQEVARAATEAGTYLAFDVVSNTGGGIEFQTFINARGVDRRFPGGITPLLLGSEFGNLAETELRIEYGEEITSAKAGGQGDGAGRLTASYTDSARVAVSPLRYREVFKDATTYSSTTGLSSEAQSVVRAGRPRLILSGKIQQTQDTQYGIDWGWGDYVTIQEFGFILDARVDAVSVKVTGDGEQIDAVVRTEQYL